MFRREACFGKRFVQASVTLAVCLLVCGGRESAAV